MMSGGATGGSGNRDAKICKLNCRIVGKEKTLTDGL